MSNKKKRHHYLPQFYLKQWATEKSKIWVKLRDKVIHTNTKNVGIENNLYSINNSDRYENWLAEIEGDIAVVYQKIFDNPNLDNEDILRVKILFALMRTRHPLMKKSIDIFAKRFMYGSNHQNTLAQTLRYRTEVIASSVEPLSFCIYQISERLSNTFITSDVPFVLTYVSQDNRIKIPLHSAWMSLSPKHLAFFTVNHSSVKQPVVKIDEPDRIFRINYQLSSVAKEMLIAENKAILNLFNIK